MIEIITVIVTILMLLATGIYVYYTKQLLEETIKLREVETSPFIGAHLDISSGLSRIIIKNIGKSPAYNLNIHFNEDVLKAIRKDMFRAYEANISYFGVEQHIVIPFHTESLFDKDIKVSFTYQSKEGIEYDENISLGLQSLSAMNISYPSLPYEKVLNDISKGIKELKK
jgi:hypothetical protein